MSRSVCGTCFCPYGDSGECACPAAPQNATNISPAPVQEPVGRVCFEGDEVVWTGDPPESGTLLYAAPPAAQPSVPLTVDQIYEIADSWAPDLEKGALCRVAREVEAAHGITATTQKGN